MAASLVVLDGSTFFVSEPSGDVDAEGADGFFFADMRHLSRWVLRIDGAPLHVLTSREIDYYSARVFGTLGSSPEHEAPPVTVQRDRIVAGGVHEDVFVDNHQLAERRIVVELLFASDFADIFEVRNRRPKRGRIWTERDRDDVVLWYEHEGYRRGTRLRFSVAPSAVEDGVARFEVAIPGRERWNLCVDVHCLAGDEEHRPRVGHGGFGTLAPHMTLSLEEWVEAAPHLHTDADVVHHTYARSLLDLAALRFPVDGALEGSVPAAGLPWFMALFGRDSLITGYMALPFHPQLARAALEALAARQATGHDDFRDADPGKILHELRRGELAATGAVPQSPYYGTHDATLLFLVLLDEYERWTGDADLVRRLEPAARAAVAWMEGPGGDPDGDGYLEYRTRSAHGLENQGWKDSGNAILFSDGRRARPPIATCEIQGYAYDARLRTARLARTCWGDAALADRLERDAAELRRRFQRDFWHEERGHFVLALDADKQQVDALTSNTGQLLWSGIVDRDRTHRVVEALMAPEMWSGWGIRTMSTADAGYSPIEYHNGTVWPHDNALIAEGLRRAGFRDEAARVVWALFEASGAFGHRLPEVFVGLPRHETVIPVEYPTASRPQAWAAAAPLLGIRTLLGLDPDGDTLGVDPHLPAALSRLELHGVPFRGRRLDASGC